MKWRTELPKKKSSFQINHQQKILLIGSCFSDNMGAKLSESLFNVSRNPFGVIYNPISIFKLLSRSLASKPITKEELGNNEDLYFHYDFHSDFNGLDENEVLLNLNTRLIETAQFLKTANVVFITLGTAWIYEQEGDIVANCHKMQSSFFKKRLLDLEEIKQSFEVVKSALKEHNCNPKIVFTVSPVRHIKDGFEENQVSKSLLRYFVNSERAHYFPSYELMLDDLRDYRFYKNDLLHPNEVALDYIWEYFQEYYFPERTKDNCEEIADLKRSLAHRPRNEESKEHKLFQDKLKQKIVDFEKRSGLKMA